MQVSIPVPVVLVAGFLGSGKTTVVNYLLAHAQGIRIAALINDFGAINIDAELITGADGVVSLSNGCICCSLEGDLLRTLASLLRRDPRPELILIETSGIADPLDIVRNLMDPVIWREAPLETVLCVVDATMSVAMLDDALLRSQLRAADVVALSKTDWWTRRDTPRSAMPSGRCVRRRWWSMRRMARFPWRCSSLRTSTACRRRASRDDGGRRWIGSNAMLDFGTAGVVSAVATGDRPACAEIGAGEGAVRTRGPARQVDGVSVRRRASHVGTGRHAGSGSASDTDGVHRRARRAVARRD